MASKSQDDSPSGVTDPLGALNALQKAGFGDIMGMSVAWTEVFSGMSAEFLGFLADRFKEDVKTQHMILHCKDMTELQRIQTEFVQTALEHYRAETGKLMEMSASMFSATTNGDRSS